MTNPILSHYEYRKYFHLSIRGRMVKVPELLPKQPLFRYIYAQIE
jgi:hypothetical protein